jgi:hypothetical protein
VSRRRHRPVARSRRRCGDESVAAAVARIDSGGEPGAALAAAGSAGDVFSPPSDEERARVSAALLEIARRPFEIDEPSRPGGVDWHDDDPDVIPERISEDESPLDLARRTQNRRERARSDLAYDSFAETLLGRGVVRLVPRAPKLPREWRTASGAKMTLRVGGSR